MKRGPVVFVIALLVYLSGVLTGAIFWEIWEARAAPRQAPIQPTESLRFAATRQRLAPRCSEDELNRSLQYFLGRRSFLHSVSESNANKGIPPTLVTGSPPRWDVEGIFSENAGDLIDGLYVIVCAVLLGER